LPFSFFLAFRPEAKSSASIIGATCTFDAKNYKIVDGFFDVSAFMSWDNKNFQIFYFCFQLPSLLVEKSAKIVN